MRRVSTIVVACTLAACAEPAQTPDSGQQMPAGTPEVHAAVSLTAAQQEGRVIYESLCWTCHGAAGRGDGPAVAAGSVTAPPTFHTPDFGQATAQQLSGRFRAGIGEADPEHPHMRYVASLLRPERFQAALSYVPALSYPAEIPGSAIAGGQIFEFRCVGCHGPMGRGNGPAAASLTVVPADFSTDTLIAARNWDALYGRIREGGRSVHGSSMPPWGVVFSDSETWDLVAYLATFQPGALSPPAWSR